MKWTHKLRLPIHLVAILSLVAACDMPTQTSTASQPEITQPGADTNAGNDPDDSGNDDGERAVVADTLPYAEVSEQLVYGHFAFPADMVDPLPGVLVIHERWGLDDGVRAQANRIAAQGFVVLAVDLFGGQTAADISGARPMMVAVLENPELAEENIRQAYQFLIDTGPAPAIGALGWSFGGGWALNTALLFPDDLDAAVIYYGQVSDDQERLEPLNVPVLGLFGAKDRGVTSETVNDFETALEALDKDYQIEIFPGAGHAFADPTASNYNADVAEQAWTLTVDFLNRNLVEDAE
jgi:carboxymethylenebutenolidase